MKAASRTPEACLGLGQLAPPVVELSGWIPRGPEVPQCPLSLYPKPPIPVSLFCSRCPLHREFYLQPSITKAQCLAALTDSLTPACKVFPPQPLVDASYRAHHPCQALGDSEAELLFSGLLVHRGQGPHPVPLYFSWCPHGPGPGLTQS